MFKKMVILSVSLVLILGVVTALVAYSGSSYAQCPDSKVVTGKTASCKTACSSACKSACKASCKTACSSACKASCKTACSSACKSACKTACSKAGKRCSSACSSCRSQKSAAVKKISTGMSYRESKRLVLAGEYVCGKCSIEKLDTCQGFIKTSDGNLYPLLKSGKLKGMCKSASMHPNNRYEVVGRVQIVNGVKYLNVIKIAEDQM